MKLLINFHYNSEIFFIFMTFIKLLLYLRNFRFNFTAFMKCLFQFHFNLLKTFMKLFKFH